MPGQSPRLDLSFAWVRSGDHLMAAEDKALGWSCHCFPGTRANIQKSQEDSPNNVLNEKWRLIWNVSEVDRLLDVWIHGDQCHGDVLTHQSLERDWASLAVGWGHDTVHISAHSIAQVIATLSPKP